MPPCKIGMCLAPVNIDKDIFNKIMASVHIKNIALGEGLPKICVPLTCGNLSELEVALNDMRDKPFGLIEWRVDKYEAFRRYIAENTYAGNTSGEAPVADEVCDFRHETNGERNLYQEARQTDNAAILSSLSSTDNAASTLSSSTADALTAAACAIRSAFPDKPLIFTIRTNRDMEDLEISDEAYADAICYAAKEGLCDIIDIEYSRGAELVAKLIKFAHDCGIKVIVSRHIADSTPDEETIINTLHDMQTVGADIVKYAAMPRHKGDVKALLDATYRYESETNSVPVITMSMGKLGVLSRISGSLTGSCLTFGTVGAASAPGQIECEELDRILNTLGYIHA